MDWSIDVPLIKLTCFPPASDRNTIAAHPGATDDAVDPNFLTNHLRAPPPYVTPGGVSVYWHQVTQVTQAGTHEKKMYKPAATGLTRLSEALYGELTPISSSIFHIDGIPAVVPESQKAVLRKRHGVRPGEPDHLVFIDHHSSPPTHFPDDTLCSVKDCPDLIAVYHPEDFTQTDGVYSLVPYHRVEGIVEAKPKHKGGGRAQAASYAYRHQQARPDHPMVYCLVIKPEGYQVILSSPNGIVASPMTPWLDDRLLVAYIYSHYYPPRDHFLVDETITWSPGPRPEDVPFWSIRFVGRDYTRGTFLFIGEPWGRRTTVLLEFDKNGNAIVIKETYRHFKRRFKEEDILRHIHGDGDVPGVVRLFDAERVKTDNKILQCGSKGAGTLRVKHRLALCDYGDRLSEAKSVNDLLEAIYDALEGEFHYVTSDIAQG